MDISTVVNLALTGSIPLLAVVMGLVEWQKRVGVAGIWLNISSMATGLILGGLYLGLTAKPDDALGIFLCALYGVMVGLIASGVYDVINGGMVRSKPGQG